MSLINLAFSTLNLKSWWQRYALHLKKDAVLPYICVKNKTMICKKDAVNHCAVLNEFMPFGLLSIPF